ncbi:hypothetical protein NDU88_006926 [Pleurodeles waltl]|uniref:Integrase catalytic domain-containing protein n=1 Tax=Pleurodeles waltl TaxID=8319 RepID=A0AAV7WG73_PLEWA|nr:hypothetical protein NDU88_006926 [Pleurodeles waltl]
MAKLKIEAQQEERRAEREAKRAEAERAAKQIEAERTAKQIQAEAERAAKQVEAERALAEKKLLLAHELSLKELEIKARQSESSNNGGSIQTGPAGEKKVRIPKNVVPSFVVGDDIDKWLAAYEVALRAHEVPEGQWGVAIKALSGWVWGNKVNDYKGLYDLILREHMLNTTFIELRQHLVDSKLTDPRELAEEEDLWISTRVSKKVPGGDSHKGGQGSQQKKEGGDKLTDKELSKGPQKNSQGGGGNHSFSRFGKKPGTFDKSGKPNPKCMECYQYGHYKGDPKCSKRAPSTTRQTPGLTSVSLAGEMDPDSFEEQVEISLVSLGEREMVPKAHMPRNTSKYRQWVTINGQKVEALRDTGASMTTIQSQLVSTEQIVPNTFHQVIVADNRESHLPVALVPFEWGGVSGTLKVAVSPAMPVDCLLGNDLEHTAWKEVELRSHLEMLGLPEWVCMTIRSMAARQGSQGRLEPGKMAQTASGKAGKRLKAPLIPLPVVGTPFERVGIDIVGPLDPKTALGNRFILVLVDHATRYPEAIPLRTVTAKVVTRALLGIFTCVGFPKEVVSDRGTNFMSAYMKTLWDECGVTYRFTTPYHPQTNGLVEIFNQTLKGMIGGLTEAMRRKWDVLLPCLLFAYREVPQKGVGFSPFELLYGHPVRGPLSIVKEGWERAPQAPPQDVVSYMLALRKQTQRFWKEAQSNLEASQEVMKE